MYVLFFCIHIFFAIALFFIHAYLEVGIFIILGIISFFFFSPFRFKKTNETHPDIEESLHTTKIIWKEKTAFFFQKMLFPIALLTFYGAIFGIVWTLEESLSFSVKDLFILLTLLVTIITGVFTLFFVCNEKIKHLLQINIGLFLGVWGIYNLVTFGEFSSLLFSWTNFFLIFIAFLLFYKKVFFQNCFFLVTFISFYFACVTNIFPWSPNNIFVLLANVLVILGIITFESWEIQYLKSKTSFLRLVGVLSVYIGSVWLLMLHIFKILPIFWIFLLAVSIIFHLYLHKRFENYVSFFLALLSITVVYNYSFGIPESFFSWIVSMGIFAFGLSFFGARQFSIRMYDRYFIQGFAIGVPIIIYITRGFLYGFGTLLEFFLILLFFSLLFFVSYIRVSSK